LNFIAILILNKKSDEPVKSREFAIGVIPEKAGIDYFPLAKRTELPYSSQKMSFGHIGFNILEGDKSHEGKNKRLARNRQKLCH